MTPRAVGGYLPIIMSGLQHTKAFVVQFREAEEPRAGQLPGRVEHVASGRTAMFQFIEELPQILKKMLNSAQADRENRME